MRSVSRRTAFRTEVALVALLAVGALLVAGVSSCGGGGGEGAPNDGSSADALQVDGGTGTDADDREGGGDIRGEGPAESVDGDGEGAEGATTDRPGVDGRIADVWATGDQPGSDEPVLDRAGEDPGVGIVRKRCAACHLSDARTAADLRDWVKRTGSASFLGRCKDAHGGVILTSTEAEIVEKWLEAGMP